MGMPYANLAEERAIMQPRSSPGQDLRSPWSPVRADPGAEGLRLSLSLKQPTCARETASAAHSTSPSTTLEGGVSALRRQPTCQMSRYEQQPRKRSASGGPAHWWSVNDPDAFVVFDIYGWETSHCSSGTLRHGQSGGENKAGTLNESNATHPSIGLLATVKTVSIILVFLLVALSILLPCLYVLFNTSVRHSGVEVSVL
ncbi:hypothetical protein MRX96_003947 [Rhipicephalus microplus]